MSTRTTYTINPIIAWINEAKGECVLVVPKNHQRIYLKGIEAILWRSIWQGLSHEIWDSLAEESGKDINKILRDWLSVGWIIKTDS